MGKRGPIPKPTNLKILQGNPGKRKPSEGEPRPMIGAPTCPDFLDKEAKAEWKRIVPLLIELRLLTLIDRGTLACYCQAYAELVMATQLLQSEGRVLEAGENGYKMPHPAVSMQRSAWKSMQGFAREFGFSPSSRTRVDVEQKETEEEELDSFLQQDRQ